MAARREVLFDITDAVAGIYYPESIQVEVDPYLVKRLVIACYFQYRQKYDKPLSVQLPCIKPTIGFISNRIYKVAPTYTYNAGDMKSFIQQHVKCLDKWLKTAKLEDSLLDSVAFDYYVSGSKVFDTTTHVLVFRQ